MSQVYILGPVNTGSQDLYLCGLGFVSVTQISYLGREPQ